MREKRPVSQTACLTVGVLIVVILVFLDQYTKLLAAHYLKGKESVSILDGVLELRYLYPENIGIAFGMFQGKVELFSLISILLFGVILWFFLKIPKERYYLPLLSVSFLMFSGAAGNFIDRVFRGYVIDFIYFSLIDFPIFNLADVYVVCAGILLVLLVLFKYRRNDDFDFLNCQTKKG